MRELIKNFHRTVICGGKYGTQRDEHQIVLGTVTAIFILVIAIAYYILTHEGPH